PRLRNRSIGQIKYRGVVMPIQRATRLLRLSLVLPALLMPVTGAKAQQATETKDADARIEQRLDHVLAALDGMQHELEASKQQISDLQAQLRELRTQMAAGNA